MNRLQVAIMETISDEDLLYLQYYQPLILPLELLPEHKVAKNLELIFRVWDPSNRQDSKQLQHCQSVLGLVTALPAKTKNCV